MLIPAAIDNVITDENAKKIKAHLILKAANHPITPEADRILSEGGVTILQDILVNAGGVIVSYSSGLRTCRNFAGKRAGSTKKSRRPFSRPVTRFGPGASKKRPPTAKHRLRSAFKGWLGQWSFAGSCRLQIADSFQQTAVSYRWRDTLARLACLTLWALENQNPPTPFHKGGFWLFPHFTLS